MKTCSLRKWLNRAFFNNVFSVAEQKQILSTTVTPDRNPSYSTDPGNNTTDKVFLLSTAEYHQYLALSDAGRCQGTAYCLAEGAKHGGCRWWLRSPCKKIYCAAYVGEGGYIIEDGDHVDNGTIAVRPALWIDLEP